jgi:cell division protein FtsN
MAVSRARGLRPGGVVRALGRLLLLLGFGFGAGLLIGVILEEPELLAGHLRGEGEAIVLTPNTEEPTSVERAGLEQDVARTDLEREAVMKPRPEEISDQPLPVVAAPGVAQGVGSDRDGVWAIQVGAFSEEAAALRIVKGLEAKGYPTELLAATGASQRWRVRVQPVRGEAKAKEMANKLKRIERLPTWVIPMEGRSTR